MLHPDKAHKFIKELDKSIVDEYERDWAKRKPLKPIQYLNRAVFSLLSIRDTQAKAIIMFKEVKPLLSKNLKKEDVELALTSVYAGLAPTKASNIFNFNQQFWSQPGCFLKSDDESFVSFRDRIEEIVEGFGPAKASYFAEMMYPDKCQVVCVESHMKIDYGVKTKAISMATYRQIEQDWVDMCKKRGFQPTFVRFIAFDQSYHEASSAYWADLLN